MASITEADLYTCIEALPPLALLGLSLLRQPHDVDTDQQGQWFPTVVPSDQIVAATLELIAYTDRCRAVAHKLVDVRPIPCDFPIAEYPL